MWGSIAGAGTVQDACKSFTVSGNTLTCVAPDGTTTPPPVSPPPVVTPPTGGAWNGTCPGFENTRVLVENWASPIRLLTSFGANDIVVVQFTTGNSASSGNLLKITGAEYSGPPTQRVATLSDKPCDFGGGALSGYWGSNTGPSTSVTVPFTIDNPNNFGFYPILHVNTTYYLNVKMAPAAGCIGDCSMFFELIKYNNS